MAPPQVIHECVRWIENMTRDRTFHAAYRQLEERMKELAESQGDIFVPNPEPEGPAQHVLICMEPSLGRWARSADEAKSKVEAGFRNFLFSIEDFILHFCARRYLCRRNEGYHITDVSKGAMLVKRANLDRAARYDQWYPLLLEEIDLVADPNASIVSVGKAVSTYLEKRGFQKPFTSVIHYSGQAARARNKAIEGQQDSFDAFRESVSLEDVLTTAKEVLRSSSVPCDLSDEVLARLAGNQLTVSRKKLIYIYKVVFESIRASFIGREASSIGKPPDAASQPTSLRLALQRG